MPYIIYEMLNKCLNIILITEIMYDIHFDQTFTYKFFNGKFLLSLNHKFLRTSQSEFPKA